MKTYWCELAWLGGDQVEPGVLLEIVDDRIAGGVRDSIQQSGSRRFLDQLLRGHRNAVGVTSFVGGRTGG
jgi:hypothetical protein